jgi:hypothetical protein
LQPGEKFKPPLFPIRLQGGIKAEQTINIRMAGPQCPMDGTIINDFNPMAEPH